MFSLRLNGVRDPLTHNIVDRTISMDKRTRNHDTTSEYVSFTHQTVSILSCTRKKVYIYHKFSSAKLLSLFPVTQNKPPSNPWSCFVYFRWNLGNKITYAYLIAWCGFQFQMSYTLWTRLNSGFSVNEKTSFVLPSWKTTALKCYVQDGGWR